MHSRVAETLQPAHRQSFATQSTATLVSGTPRPSSATTMVAPSRPSTGTTMSFHSEGKRQPRSKETQFQMKYGHKHHSYDPEKAPYPVSYDRRVLELESLDTHFVMYLKDSVSMVPEFKETPPERSLDLGCGSGSWIINAAKEWPNCEFVGFDLVNVQLPVGLMQDPSLEKRLTWMHGNFLTTKLPFDDDEFDHVHIKGISRGVPENKWDFLFAEVNRVLTPGGAVEIMEDDIMFPVLPRWFTAPLRARTKRATSIHYPNGAQRPSSIPSPSPTPLIVRPPHDHALLESLFHSVYENRFINMRPSAVLPIYFTTYFRHVQSAPVTNFPMPPVPPPQPLPQPLSPNASGLDMLTSSLLGGSSPPATRPVSLSFSSTMSAASDNASTSISTTDSNGASIFSQNANSESFSSAESQSASPEGKKRTLSTPLHPSSPPKNSTAQSKRSVANSSTNDSTSIGPASMLVPKQRLNEMNERSLAMHLYCAFRNVMAVQESMWEELKDWVRNKKDALKELGWDEDEDEDMTELSVRLRFEKLLERYQSDMHMRISFWCSLTELDFHLPPKEPLTKAEHIEEERIHKAIKEAMQSASDEDLQSPCRSVRVIVGFKKIPKIGDEEFDAIR